MAYPHLIEHAIKNVWCNPDQDNQLIFQPYKISKDAGVYNQFLFMNRSLPLPNNGKKYHVYQIGQLRPMIVGLLGQNPDWVYEKWFSFKEAINTLKLFVNIYTAKGIEIPRFSSYYMLSNERNLIIAIEESNKIPVDFIYENIYVRLYTNAYFQSLRADAVSDYIYCEGKIVTSEQSILDMQALCEQYRNLTGHTFCYKNGYLIDKIDLVNVSIYDVVELVYDSSIKRVVTFSLDSLTSFLSLLDNKYKYLLHHSFEDNDTIDYQDDIDIHVVSYKDDNRFFGYYYNRNAVDSHRMVTHRDYSIVVNYVDYIKDYLEERIGINNLDGRTAKVEVKIRNSGYLRPLIYDNNRLFELYKLDDNLILEALNGLNSSLDIWRADYLEASAYTEIMRSEYRNITLDLVQEAYGYNSVSKLVGDTPSNTYLYSGLETVDVPYELQDNCTAYEYDANGHLLGYHHHTYGSLYHCADNNAKLVEIISGRGSINPSVVFGTDNIDLPTIDNYRVYMCYLVNNIPNEEWIDITGSEHYSIINNKLVWNNLETDQYIMVRNDANFLTYDLNFTAVGGNLFFTLEEEETRFDQTQNYSLPVPLGELDIFLNGKSLIKDLDYIVKFPMVYIINKKHVAQPVDTALQHIHVRFTGFCKSDLTLNDVGDYGFIEHGVLSNDYEYDIRDDKVLRIIVDGSIKTREDLIFSEFHSGVSVTDIDNGKPYQIRDIIVPLKQLVNENTYSLRDKSLVIDKKVSDYMTLKVPQPERNAVSAIPELYPVVSPFFARIIEDLVNNIIKDSDFGTMSDNEVLDICNPYEYLLDYDPINDQNALNSEYVIIHPHLSDYVYNVSLYKYRFLLKVIKLYADGLIDISNFISITT